MQGKNKGSVCLFPIPKYTASWDVPKCFVKDGCENIGLGPPFYDSFYFTFDNHISVSPD